MATATKLAVVPMDNKDLNITLAILDFQKEEDKDDGYERFSGTFVDESPVERWFGYVKFRAKKSDWKLERLEAENVYWSVNHGNLQIGVVEDVSFRNGKGRFTARFVKALEGDFEVMRVQNNIRNGDLKGVSMEIGPPDEVILVEEGEDMWDDVYEFRGQSLDGITSTMRPAFGAVGVGDYTAQRQAYVAGTSNNNDTADASGNIVREGLPDLLKQAYFTFREERNMGDTAPDAQATTTTDQQAPVAQAQGVAPEGMISVDSATQMFSNILTTLHQNGVTMNAIADDPNAGDDATTQQDAEPSAEELAQRAEFQRQSRSVQMQPHRFADYERENAEKRGSAHFAMGEYFAFQMNPQDPTVQRAAAGEIRRVEEQEDYADAVIAGAKAAGWTQIPIDAILSFVNANPHRRARLGTLNHLFALAGTGANTVTPSQDAGGGDITSNGLDWVPPRRTRRLPTTRWCPSSATPRPSPTRTTTARCSTSFPASRSARVSASTAGGSPTSPTLAMAPSLCRKPAPTPSGV